MVVEQVVEEVVNNTGVIGEVVIEIGRVANWIQAIGFIIVLWIVFQIISLIVGRKKRKALYMIRADLERIEGKLDRVLKKK